MTSTPTPGTARAAFHPKLHALIDILGVRFVESNRLESILGYRMHGAAAGRYFPVQDVISVQRPKRMYSARGINAVLLHEIGHWTGAESRCARLAIMNMAVYDLPTQAERDQEEAVAELTSVKLLTHFGLKGRFTEYQLDLALLANPPYDMDAAVRESDKAAKYVLAAMAAA